MEDRSLSTPIKKEDSKNFLLVCLLSTLALVLGYYFWILQQKKQASSSSTSAESLIAAMMQTKGVIEAEAFVLFLKADGTVQDYEGKPYASDEALRTALASAVKTKDTLRIEGTKDAPLSSLLHVFTLAREVGFLGMKYQILPDIPQELVENSLKKD